MDGQLLTDCETEGSVKDEMRRLMQSHSGTSNEQFARVLYDYLKRKYDDREWLAIVYDGVTGFQNHIVSTDHYVFRQGGKNAAVWSIKIDHRPLQPHSRAFLDNTHLPKADARDIKNRLTNELKDQGLSNDYKVAAVIRHGQGLKGTYDGTRVFWLNFHHTKFTYIVIAT
jgi:hypothetical protein